MGNSTPHALVAGTSFKSSPIEVREKLARLVNPKSLLKFLEGKAFEDSFGILSTCNRTEIYTFTDDPSHTGDQLIQYFTLLEEEVKGYLYVYSDLEAIRHIFRVACGLDSMVLGEPQILLQVKHAELVTRSGNHQALQKLFRNAYFAGRRIRSKAGIGNTSSVSSAALELIQSKFNPKPNLLLVGAGKMATEAIRAIRKTRLGEIHVANRTPRREATAFSGGLKFHSLDEIPTVIPKVDVVVVATSSSGYTVTGDMLRARGRKKRMLIVDISMPRNVDPAVGSLLGVELYDIDDLIPYARPLVGKEKLRQIEKEIDNEARRLASWLLTLEVAPMVRQIRTRAESIRREEVQEALRRLSGHKRTDAEVLSALSTNIVNRLLHEPTIRLREHAKNGDAEGYTKIAGDLFGIDD